MLVLGIGNSPMRAEAPIIGDFCITGMHGGKIILRCSVLPGNLSQRVKVTPQVGFACEFYLFEQDEKGRPTRIPFDCAGYLDIALLDKGENVRREIGLTLEQMGIKVFSSHHEAGPGQNEIVLKYEGALTAADSLITFKSVVTTVAERNVLFASLMPKPILDKSGNGLHINLSLAKNGVNIFKAGDEHSSDAESFVAGILDRIREITAVT